ncbi:amino acid ABC transporter ATP-binding/permease protein [Streptomyces acidicola]|uniref:amino acid ABC transporter ATP-binding/permease protein n=1 Tax=Streptomyces acidicola TaxID=2596892 RepID=UPI0038026655
MNRRLMLACLAGASASLAGLGLIGSAAWLITRAAQQPPLAVLSVAIVSVRACATLRGVFRYGERLAGHDVALRAQARARSRLFRALVPGLRPAGRGGDLLTRMVSDTEAVQDLLVRCLLPTVAALATVGAAVTVGLLLLPVAALVLAVGLLSAGVLLPTVTAVTAHRRAARIAAARAELSARSADLVHGAVDLAAHDAGAWARAATAEADTRLAALERRQAHALAATTAAGVLLQGLTVAGVVLVAHAHRADTVATAVLVLTALTAFEPVLPLIPAGERLTATLASLRRLRTVHTVGHDDGPGGSRGRGNTGDPEPDTLAPPAGPLTVEIRDLVVRYGPERAPALDGVGLTLAPGRRVALVGPSGSGKSTLLDVLMRMVEPESGSVFLDFSQTHEVHDTEEAHRRHECREARRTEFREFPPDTVRGLMTGLAQDPYVFHASLRDNLRLARPSAGDAELAAALRSAGLEQWAEHHGWDEVLGEDGRSLSGGQLQRLALARALLGRPQVLLLDEPSEALDEMTADALMTDLLNATRGRTALLVTHRLRGLEQVDEIVVLERGRIVQRGTHTGLLAVPGYYRDAWFSERLAQIPNTPDGNTFQAIERTNSATFTWGRKCQDGHL